MPGPAPGDGEEEREGRERGFQGGSVMKNPPANGEDADSTPVPGRSPPPRTEPGATEHACTAAREVDLIRSSAGGLEFLFLWLPSVTQQPHIWVPWPSRSVACPLLAWRPGPRGSLWPQRVSVFAGAVDLASGRCCLVTVPLPLLPQWWAEPYYPSPESLAPQLQGERFFFFLFFFPVYSDLHLCSADYSLLSLP